MFLLGVALVVAAGLFPVLRPAFLKAGKSVPLDMATTIQIVMLSMAALILAVTRVPAGNVPKTPSSQAGVTAVVGIFGLAWLGDTFIKANEKLIIGQIGELTAAYPVVFAVGLFFASVLLFSQAATTRALMPLGISLGLPLLVPHRLVARGERLLLPSHVRDHHRRHQLRPERDDPDRPVRPEPLLHAPRTGGDVHRRRRRPRDRQIPALTGSRRRRIV